MAVRKISISIDEDALEAARRCAEADAWIDGIDARLEETTRRRGR